MPPRAVRAGRRHPLRYRHPAKYPALCQVLYVHTCPLLIQCDEQFPSVCKGLWEHRGGREGGILVGDGGRRDMDSRVGSRRDRTWLFKRGKSVISATTSSEWCSLSYPAVQGLASRNYALKRHLLV